MARDFPTERLAIRVPLGTTWEESWQLTDETTGLPLDLTDYEFRMMVRDKRTGLVLLEIATAGVDPRATITPLTGTIDFKVDAEDVGDLTPADVRRPVAGVFDSELYKPAGVDPIYVVPVLAGSVQFTPRVTRPVP